jgi:hypothetical protein
MSTAAAPPAEAVLPGDLAHIPPAEYLRERFGWVAGLVALACLLVMGLALALDPWEPKGVVLFGAIGGACAVAEITRRRAAATLVRRGGRVGVYRRGRRAAIIPLERAELLPANPREAAQPVAASLLVGATGLLPLALAQPGEPLLPVVAVTLFGLGGGSAWSVVRTETQLRQVRLPRGQGSDTLLLLPGDAVRLFEGTPGHRDGD